MLRIYLTIVFSLSFLLSFGQDVIHMKSGDKVKTKIVEELDLKVRYRKFKEVEGPIYVLFKKDIQKIVYENGEVNSFKVSSNKTNENINSNDIPTGPDVEIQRIKEKSKLYNKRRNLIGFNYAQMILLNMEFTYEIMIAKSGFFGIKIPISIGINLRNTYLKRNNLVSTGLQFNIYPMGQGKVSYLTGPSFRYFYMQDNPNFFDGSVADNTRSNYIAFYINNGVLFQASSFLNFSLGLGLGTRLDANRSDAPSHFDVTFDGSIIFRI